MRQAWPIIEPATEYVHGWHIDAICEHLEAVTRGDIKNLIINIPPRHMKSILVSVMWPTWVWINRPDVRWMFTSYSQDFAMRDSLKCRRIIESPWYQVRWGDAYRLTDDQNSKTRFENDKTGFRLAAGVGGMSTGEGGNVVVCDDPLKATDAHSAAARHAVNRWWDETMTTRRNDPKASARVVIMQRLHEDDLTGHLLAKMEAGGTQYEHLCLPVEYTPTARATRIGWRDPRRMPGELLWPQRFDAASIAELKADLGSYGAAGQLQQMPAPAEGGIFKRQQWRFWIPKGSAVPPYRTALDDGTLYEHPQRELPEAFDQMLQSWDMAFKDTRNSDFVAGQVWARSGANRFLVDQEFGRLDIIATVKAVRAMTDRWPKAGLKLIEDKANGPAVIAMLRDEIGGLVAVEPEGGKEARAHAVIPQIEAGNVYLPHPALYPWVTALIDRAAAFPNAAHDDDIDAMTQALNRWGSGKGMAMVVAL